MKKLISVCAGIVLYATPAFAQHKDSFSESKWSFNMEGDFYFTDPFYIIPIFTADKNWLHLEARYNYEELKTFSGWVGYNFYGGEKFTYSIIPMAGFTAGRLAGLAPGFELDLNYAGFEFSSQSEYVFDLEDSEKNFYYSWLELTYSPADWLYFGLSAQRTKAVGSDLDIQTGLLAGTGFKNLGLTLYYFNPGNEDRFFLLTMSAGF